MMAYDLWYWPGIQGRGEFVRLVMEAAEIDYVDRARRDGAEALVADMQARGRRPPFAPPYLVMGDLAIAQVANILMYLGERHDLRPSSMADRLWLNQFQLTVSDLVAEVHDVHHPVDAGAYYDEQKPEAARAAAQFRAERLPKFLGWFERAIAGNDGPWAVDHRWTCADTSVFQLVEGLRYMFPRRMTTLEPDHPELVRIHDRVAELPGVQAYLKSERRIPFNEDGVFRHYPELDSE